jgi:hypothetical protein
MNKNQPNVFCRFTEMRPLVSLVEHPRNPNTHPQTQLERLADVIRGNGWRQPITVSDLSGYIIKGHGRYQAAKLAGFSEVPVEVQHYENEAAELADMLADNRIAELSEMDMNALNATLQALQVEDPAAVELSGYTDDEWASIRAELDGIANEEDTEPDDTYTSKVERPQYEPTGEAPPIEELVNPTKTAELLAEIESATGITDAERAFLIQAAQRHLQFSYQDVAEYYASASPEMQRLMEASALVIIDYDDAIKHGYARLTASLQEQKEAENVPEEP